MERQESLYGCLLLRLDFDLLVQNFLCHPFYIFIIFAKKNFAEPILTKYDTEHFWIKEI